MHVLNILIVLFALGASHTVHALCDGDKTTCVSKPKWTIENLTKHTSLHDGPNCFNAALVAAGLFDEIVYVDTLEYAFYLESFCTIQNQSTTAAGNLFVYLGIEPTPMMVDENDLRIMHGSFSLGSGKIIEKTSNTGSLHNKAQGRDRPGVYRIKHLSQSAYATKASGAKVVQSYRCEPRDAVLSKISILNADPLAKQMSAFRTEFTQKLQTQAFSKITGLSEQIRGVIAALEQREGLTEVDLYVAALARSLVGTIETVMSEEEGNYNETLTQDVRDLTSASFDLMEKINTKTNFWKTKPLLIKY